jgi:hypothetical protein
MTSSRAGALIRHSSDRRRRYLINWSAVQNFARDFSPCTSPQSQRARFGPRG